MSFRAPSIPSSGTNAQQTPGCGDGRIAEYLSDRTGAHMTGLDDISEVIRLARERTSAVELPVKDPLPRAKDFGEPTA